MLSAIRHLVFRFFATWRNQGSGNDPAASSRHEGSRYRVAGTSSADGTRLAAADNGDGAKLVAVDGTPGQIYTFAGFTGTPGTFPAIVFPRRISDPNLVIEVEVATDLTNWHSGEGYTVEEPVTPIDSDSEVVTVRSAVQVGTEGKQQTRIRFTLDETP